MMNRGIVVAMTIVCLAGAAQLRPKTNTPAKNTQPRSAQMQVAPDLKQRLARFRQVQMPFHSQRLSEREKQLVLKLVDDVSRMFTGGR
jgi:hypothetical protein